MKLRFSDLLRWSRATPNGKIPEFCSGVTQDTRKIVEGNLYVALKGERFDGHDFTAKAFENGAAAALVSLDWQIPSELQNAPLLRVHDPLKALCVMAGGWRKQSHATIIGLTGSAGKTTTKELTAAFLSAEHHRVRATQGNLNNGIGLPLSLLTLEENADFGVFETGTNHPGEIKGLAEILQPDAAILTNIGTAHIEHFISQSGIAKEKGTLLEMVPAKGFVVLPSDTACIDEILPRIQARVISVSLKNSEASYFGICKDLNQGIVDILERESGITRTLKSRLPGEHNALNLLLAYATARTCGIHAEAIPESPANFQLPGMRWLITEQNGITFINDAYNANPQSMEAVIKTFQARKCPGRKILLLGDMLELGNQAEALHRNVGKTAAEIHPDFLLTVGPLSAAYMADEALHCGMTSSQVKTFPDALSAKSELTALLRSGDTLLLKASRGIGLEQALPN